MPNTICLEKYPELKDEFIRPVLAVDRDRLNTSERVAELLCCLPTFAVPAGLTYENMFRVTIVAIPRPLNFCVGNVKRTCIHFVTPKGEIIPFDTYNLFYRNGAIDNIRARMAGQAFRSGREELQR